MKKNKIYNNSKIYVINQVEIHNDPETSEYKIECHQVAGYYFNRREAIHAVRYNSCDLNETCFNYIFLEAIEPGLFPTTERPNKDRLIFKYNKQLNRYIKAVLPKEIADRSFYYAF